MKSSPPGSHSPPPSKPQPTAPTAHASALEEAAVMFKELSATYSTELESKKARLDDLIGDTHWLTVGHYKEALIRGLLTAKVPRRFEVSTGFVMTLSAHGRVVSKELDVIVWDSANHSPIFRDRDFVIVPPEACHAVISVKGKLDQAELAEALDNLESLTPFIEFARPGTTMYRAVFAFDKADDLKFPNSVFNSIYAHYSRQSDPTIDKRIGWTRNDTNNPTLPWINCIAILNEGVVSLQEWTVNAQTSVCYAGIQTREKLNDTYGFVERDLIAALLVGNKRGTMHLTHPGMRNVLFCAQPEFVAGQACMLIPAIEPTAIRTIGRLTGSDLTKFVSRVYKPRKPRLLARTFTAQSARELFDYHVPNVLASKRGDARKIGGTYLVSIPGQDGGEWTIDLESDPPTCRAGKMGKVKCTVIFPPIDFKSVIEDPKLVTTLSSKGNLQVTGMKSLVANLTKILFLGP